MESYKMMSKSIVSMFVASFIAVPFYLLRYKGLKRTGLLVCRFVGFLALFYLAMEITIFLIVDSA